PAAARGAGAAGRRRAGSGPGGHLGTVRAGGPGRAVRAGAGRLGGAGVTRVVPSVPAARAAPGFESATEAGPGAGPLAALFEPRGVAVVGASRTAGKLGAAMARSLAGFGGHLALVNPRDDTMYPSVRAAAADGPV